MRFDLGTVLIITAFAAALFLLFAKSDRLFPTIAVVAAGIELLLATRIMTLSLSKFRVDVILPALLLIAGGVSWGRASEKGTVTAATVIAFVAALQLVLALRLL
ncbi:MAG TPA: hypothetical protein VM513_25560, partial [Kofleriaceae bacterium]|nr:hypothetical protein [Kofleriaceae bacterium]